MTPAFSLYLDALRFGAAFIVLLSHWAYARFTDGTYLWLREYNLGSDAVMIFFVLSGLVISYTAHSKDETAKSFAFARATRILSVALPAILLTWLLDSAGSVLNPAAYDGWWYEGDNYAQRALAAATFTNQIWFTELRLGSNGPYWSLSYEVWYYVLFGLLFFMRGRMRWVLFGGLLVVLGPRIALLLPAWLMGVAVERGLQMPVPARTARLMAIIPPVLYIALLAIGAPDVLRTITQALLGADMVNALHFSDEFLWNNLIAGLTAIHLLGMAKLDIRLPAPTFIRWAAGGSFTLYLLHYPLLQFFDAAVPLATGPMRDTVLLAATIIGCALVAAVTERRLGMLRALLTKISAR
ncbi:MAG: acyltransferase family protein [Bdellovibrionales bacterium]